MARGAWDTSAAECVTSARPENTSTRAMAYDRNGTSSWNADAYTFKANGITVTVPWTSVTEISLTPTELSVYYELNSMSAASAASIAAASYFVGNVRMRCRMLVTPTFESAVWVTQLIGAWQDAHAPPPPGPTEPRCRAPQAPPPPPASPPASPPESAPLLPPSPPGQEAPLLPPAPLEQ